MADVAEALHRFTPWTPNAPVTLGDVGTVVDGVFEHRTTLASLGIDVSTIVASAGGRIDFASSPGVDLVITPARRRPARTGGRGGNAAEGARARVGFARAGDGLLQARDVDVVVLGDAGRVADGLLSCIAAGTWERDWVFVHEVHTAAVTTVLVSGGDDTRIELVARGALDEHLPLASGFVVSAREGDVASWVGARGFTPLFGLSRVKPALVEALLAARGGPKRRTTPYVGHGSRALLEEVALERRRAP